MPTSIFFAMQNNFYFSDYSIASLWFEPRIAMLFKLMTTAEKISGIHMKILKLSDMNFMKNIRIRNGEKICHVLWNTINCLFR